MFSTGHLWRKTLKSGEDVWNQEKLSGMKTGKARKAISIEPGKAVRYEIKKSYQYEIRKSDQYEIRKSYQYEIRKSYQVWNQEKLSVWNQEKLSVWNQEKLSSMKPGKAIKYETRKSYQVWNQEKLSGISGIMRWVTGKREKCGPREELISVVYTRSMGCLVYFSHIQDFLHQLWGPACVRL